MIPIVDIFMKIQNIFIWSVLTIYRNQTCEIDIVINCEHILYSYHMHYNQKICLSPFVQCIYS